MAAPEATDGGIWLCFLRPGRGAREHSQCSSHLLDLPGSPEQQGGAGRACCGCGAACAAPPCSYPPARAPRGLRPRRSVRPSPAQSQHPAPCWICHDQVQCVSRAFDPRSSGSVRCSGVRASGGAGRGRRAAAWGGAAGAGPRALRRVERRAIAPAASSLAAFSRCSFYHWRATPSRRESASQLHRIVPYDTANRALSVFYFSM
jgi:hypothetical protein